MFRLLGRLAVLAVAAFVLLAALPSAPRGLPPLPEGLKAPIRGAIHVHTNRSDGTSSVNLNVTNPVETRGAHSTKSPTLSGGAFGILLSDLPQGVTLQSASVTVNGTLVNLEITHDAAGDPIVTLPKSIVSSLSAGESLPEIALTFAGTTPKHFDFNVEVFTDPFGA